jgi:hypothetical protein
MEHAENKTSIKKHIHTMGRTSPYTQQSQETNIHAAGGIRTRNPSKQAAENPKLKPRGHRDRPTVRRPK